jgi:serine/threonine protein phosphatase PrpC
MSEFTHPEAAAQHNISRGDEASMRYRLAVAHEEMNSRRRNTMEDCHRILPTLNEGPDNFSYFGIYDGHGGRQLVDFLEESLEQNLITELKEPDDASVLERMSR